MAGKLLYQSEVRHIGLNKYKIIKAETRYELEQKVKVLKAQWEEQWQKQREAERKRTEKEEKLKCEEDSLAYANERTQQAEKKQQELDLILLSSLKPIPFDFNSMKDFSKFNVKKPEEPSRPNTPTEPKLTDIRYNPNIPLFFRFSKRLAEEFQNKNVSLFKKDWAEWESIKNSIELRYSEEMKKYNENLVNWEKQRYDFMSLQTKRNNDVNYFIKKYNDGDSDAISKYYTLVLESIELPFAYDRQFDIEYRPNNKMIIIDMMLPSMDNLPKLKKVTYIKTKNQFTEAFHSEAYLKKKYDSVVYQMVLQSLNYIFKLNEKNHIESAVLNGKVNTIDKASGNVIEPCVLTINISKKDFNVLNLSNIDPRAWFKSAKGISAAEIAGITPVAPIVELNRNDGRFVEGYNVTNTLNEGVNLAAIDWLDFENLIRELFEQEFNVNGGEVKITRASRDGGVDAVAFDPDPIRGGKIVIQAKRYTNVVGVSAVRDLYGTVLNEGATKGILVTTSNYGNDAYAFAKGKPLTLMDGANLLHLLQIHGHKARIDLKEAKKILKDAL